MTHDTCTSKKVSKVMKEFEKKKLKQRDGKIIKDKKQAIAIALSQAEKECTISKKEYEEMLENVLSYLTSKPTDHIILSRIIEARELIEYYYKKDKTKKCIQLEALLWHYVLSNITSGNTISKNVWDELNKIKNIDFKRF
jgi:hypothetical protein